MAFLFTERDLTLIASSSLLTGQSLLLSYRITHYLPGGVAPQTRG